MNDTTQKKKNKYIGYSPMSELPINRKYKKWRIFNPKFEYVEKFEDLGWPWYGHRHFAYELIRNLKPNIVVEIGTHRGTSFFSFCQAVKDGGINTKLYAIDNWKGDEHSGFYGNEVFEEVNEIKNKYYKDQKIKLLRKTFDEALSEFSDKVIDVLHIDGFHTYDVVKHDFERWRNKVSDQGIILFHDIKVIEDDFGVYKLWGELKSKYKTIEFFHSFGLGVLFKNKNRQANEFLKLEKNLQMRYSYEYEMLRNQAIQGMDKNLQSVSQLINLNKNNEEDIKKLRNEVKTLTEVKLQLQSILDNIISAKTFKLWQGFNKTKKIAKKALHDPRKIIKIGRIFFQEGPRGIEKRLANMEVVKNNVLNINQRYQNWFMEHYPSEEEISRQQNDNGNLKYSPKISLITPVFNTPINFLAQCIESLINQTYNNWELCIADDASYDNAVREKIKEYAEKDKRIKYILGEKNGHICEASNSALSLAKGEFIGFLDHDDILWPNCLYEVAKVINKNRDVEFIYSDEDKLDYDGFTHIDPFFKPDWSPDFLRSLNYITHFAVIKKSLIHKVGAFRKGYEGAQDWDLFLRATLETEKKNVKNKIIHIPSILYSWRKSSLSTSSPEHIQTIKKYAINNQKKVLESDLANRKLKGKVISTEYLGLWRVKYNIIGNPLVSIIIPTKDQYELIKPCLESIIEKSTYKNYELIIVDTGSKNKDIWKLYENVQNRYAQTKVIHWKNSFNFSSVCNYGSKNSNGEYFLFLNNDTEIVTTTWIEALLEHAQRKEVGAVGAKLLYPDNTIQHAGIVFNPKFTLDGLILPSHIYKNYQNNVDYAQLNGGIYGTANYIAVTGACLMIDSKKFKAVGGMNSSYKLAFNDIDFCLKLLVKGYQNVYTSHGVLIHHESATMKRPGDSDRNMLFFKQELELLHKKWKHLIYNDPYFNRNTIDIF